jgi:HSP20 family protein
MPGVRATGSSSSSIFPAWTRSPWTDVERNVLTVHAKRPDLDPDREMVSAERPRGVFSRQLFLGETLNADQIEASYGGGVLRLTIPVAERAKPRRIKVASDEKTAINA